jgi:hypothetical protein
MRFWPFLTTRPLSGSWLVRRMSPCRRWVPRDSTPHSPAEWGRGQWRRASGQPPECLPEARPHHGLCRQKHLLRTRLDVRNLPKLLRRDVPLSKAFCSLDSGESGTRHDIGNGLPHFFAPICFVQTSKRQASAQGDMAVDGNPDLIGELAGFDCWMVSG